MSSQGQTITWTGAGDGLNWEDAANWDLGFVPTLSNDVVIASAGVQISSAAECKSLVITNSIFGTTATCHLQIVNSSGIGLELNNTEAICFGSIEVRETMGTSVAIDVSSLLEVHDSLLIYDNNNEIGIDIQNRLDNEGVIWIENVGSGIYSKKVFINSGDIVIKRSFIGIESTLGSSGFNNSGSICLIHVHRCMSLLSGIVTNSGLINMDSIGVSAINANGCNIMNELEGEVRIANVSDSSNAVLAGLSYADTVTNYGIIDINHVRSTGFGQILEQDALLMNYGLIKVSGGFVGMEFIAPVQNMHDGILQIDNPETFGMLIRDTIINFGQIILDSTTTAINVSGNQGAVFNVGEIRVSNNDGTGINCSSSSQFTNDTTGCIEVLGSFASNPLGLGSAISLLGPFLNNGSIHIHDIATDGLGITGSNNQKNCGQISIEHLGKPDNQAMIVYSTEFENSETGQINISNGHSYGLEIVNTCFQNRGDLTITDFSVGISVQGAGTELTNYARVNIDSIKSVGIENLANTSIQHLGMEFDLTNLLGDTTIGIYNLGQILNFEDLLISGNHGIGIWNIGFSASFINENSMIIENVTTGIFSDFGSFFQNMVGAELVVQNASDMLLRIEETAIFESPGVLTLQQ